MSRFAVTNLALMLIVIVSHSSRDTSASSQVTKLGSIVAADATPLGPLVVREIDKASGIATGTMPAAHAAAIATAVKGLAAFAIVQSAGAHDGVRFPSQSPQSPSVRTSEVTFGVQEVIDLKAKAGRLFVVADQRAGRAVALVVDGAWIAAAGLPAVPVGAKGSIQRATQRFEVEIVGILDVVTLAANPELDPATQIVVLKTDAMNKSDASSLAYSPVIRPVSPARVKDVQSKLSALAESLARQPEAVPVTFRLESFRQKK